MDDYPIKLGPILFTMVDPNPGFEVAYNRWYERDHFYAATMAGPGVFAGGDGAVILGTTGTAVSFEGITFRAGS